LNSKQGVEQLHLQLIASARKRKAESEEAFAPMDFEKFIQAVDRVGDLTELLFQEGIDLAHAGMALDYYSRAIALGLDSAIELMEQEVGGTA
jgi:hypothetical protein